MNVKTREQVLEELANEIELEGGRKIDFDRIFNKLVDAHMEIQKLKSGWVNTKEKIEGRKKLLADMYADDDFKTPTDSLLLSSALSELDFAISILPEGGRA